MKKKLYKETIESMREIIERQSNRATDLSQQIQSKDKLLNHYESMIKHSESACIYHQERADKADQVIEEILKLAGCE